MKHILFTVLTFVSFNILAQVPQGVGYQGVATDSEGIELVNQSISIKASVLSSSANGTIEWEETHTTSTDTFGLFNLTIGQGINTGNSLQVNFADISWGTNTHFLKIEMDATGGNDFSFMGTNQMMSVPYALYAESANINYDSISNFLSGDSTFITNVGSEMGGGCDYSFPEGLEGDMIPWDLSNGNDYTVPAGKNLFITNIHTNDGSSFRIDGVRFLDEKWGISNTSNNDEIGMLRHPLCVKSGQVISASTNSTYTETFYGVLTDAVVEPISFWFDNVGSGNESYTVPNGKKLVVTNIWMYGSSNSDLMIDGVVIAAENFNKPEANSNKYIEIPLIVESGSIISIPNNYSSFNGYLVDENYFEGCGGGGSSSTSSLDSTAIANMIANSGGNMVFGEYEDITSQINNNLTNTAPYPEYQQNEDGFLYIILNPSNQWFQISIDSVSMLPNGPSGGSYYPNSLSNMSLLIPLKKDYYWTFSAYLTSVNKAFWIPLKSGGGSSTTTSSNSVTDFSYPDGKEDITPITYFSGTYTPPNNKNLYITSVISNLQISSNSIFTGQGNLGTGQQNAIGHPNLPIIVSETDVVDGDFNGFLVDATVDPITMMLTGAGTYTVPSGKILVILNAHLMYGSLDADGNNLLSGYFNYYGSITDCSPTCFPKNLKSPIFVDENTLLTAGSGNGNPTSGIVTFNGYLMDK